MRRQLIVTFAALAAFAAPPAAAEFVSFTSLPDTALSFTSSGVTFTAPGGRLAAYQTPDGSRGVLGQALVGDDSVPIKAVIAGGASNVSVRLGDFGMDADALFLEAYDASSNLIASTSYDLPANVSGMRSLGVAVSNISYVLFGSKGPGPYGSSVIADDFSFTPANLSAVPEPATWAMLMTGFASTGVAMRRRRARPAAA